jgi:hypothetical protein
MNQLLLTDKFFILDFAINGFEFKTEIDRRKRGLGF